MQQGRQRAAQWGGQAQHGGNAQLAHRLFAFGFQLCAGLAGRLQHDGALRIEALPRFGQAVLAGGALQQRQARLRLQLADVLAHGRGRHAQRTRGGAHRALLHHGGEHGHAIEVFHGLILKYG
ncbi:hypothetical protein D3C72_1641960 [compost metagenome]